VAVKASAGAAEHVRMARVVNLVRALEQVKAGNIWCVGLDERGTMDYTEYDFTTPCLVVLGREGAGLHALVRRTCDHLLRIPMAGKVASLNVSAAGAVVWRRCGWFDGYAVSSCVNVLEPGSRWQGPCCWCARRGVRDSGAGLTFTSMDWRPQTAGRLPTAVAAGLGAANG